MIDKPTDSGAGENVEEPEAVPLDFDGESEQLRIEERQRQAALKKEADKEDEMNRIEELIQSASANIMGVVEIENLSPDQKDERSLEGLTYDEVLGRLNARSTLLVNALSNIRAGKYEFTTGGSAFSDWEAEVDEALSRVSLANTNTPPENAPEELLMSLRQNLLNMFKEIRPLIEEASSEMSAVRVKQEDDKKSSVA